MLIWAKINTSPYTCKAVVLELYSSIIKDNGESPGSPAKLKTTCKNIEITNGPIIAEYGFSDMADIAKPTKQYTPAYKLALQINKRQ